jgi:transposase-like protein
MGKQRQSWSVEEKLATVLAVLSEHQSVAEVARQRGVNENQVHDDLGGGERTAHVRASSGLPSPASTTHLDRARAGSAVDGRIGFAAAAADEEKASRPPRGG